MMRWHERENKPMPNDWAITKDGYETTNPSDKDDLYNQYNVLVLLQYLFYFLK